MRTIIPGEIYRRRGTDIFCEIDSLCINEDGPDTVLFYAGISKNNSYKDVIYDDIHEEKILFFLEDHYLIKGIDTKVINKELISFYETQFED